MGCVGAPTLTSTMGYSGVMLTFPCADAFMLDTPKWRLELR